MTCISLYESRLRNVWLTPKRFEYAVALCDTDKAFHDFVMYCFPDEPKDITLQWLGWQEKNRERDYAEFTPPTDSLAKFDKWQKAIRAFMSLPKKERDKGFLVWKLGAER